MITIDLNIRVSQNFAKIHFNSSKLEFEDHCNSVYFILIVNGAKLIKNHFNSFNSFKITLNCYNCLQFLDFFSLTNDLTVVQSLLSDIIHKNVLLNIFFIVQYHPFYLKSCLLFYFTLIVY